VFRILSLECFFNLQNSPISIAIWRFVGESRVPSLEKGGAMAFLKKATQAKGLHVQAKVVDTQAKVVHKQAKIIGTGYESKHIA